ncbi:MAG TPA: hypothetical protein VJH92_06595 [Candidatus Nanoarchaeia archaeon]|nr:hypothetical protein [Candidatus Nanoarchaeia archaeon]
MAIETEELIKIIIGILVVVVVIVGVYFFFKEHVIAFFDGLFGEEPEVILSLISG